MSSAPADGTNAAPAEPQPAQVWPPIVFYVAKGDPNACGRGCGEWIAAEGTIDENAPRRLRDLLNRLGQRKLPIFFHSPGGSVGAGLTMAASCAGGRDRWCREDHSARLRSPPGARGCL